MVTVEKSGEVLTMQYGRDVRGTGRKAVIAAYEERWGEGCIPVRPDRTILVSTRKVPGTQ